MACRQHALIASSQHVSQQGYGGLTPRPSGNPCLKFQSLVACILLGDGLHNIAGIYIYIYVTGVSTAKSDLKTTSKCKLSHTAAPYVVQHIKV